jgi:hypothetical protein
MILPASALLLALTGTFLPGKGAAKEQGPPLDDQVVLRRACPDYTSYAEIPQ